MSLRATFHTKTGKSKDKTSFDKKFSLKPDNTEGDREIVFIGHSATWLPVEQKKVKIEDNLESNKKIVFVGHSATWIPTSPSKQRSTSFSTSAIQLTQSVQTEKQCKENVSVIEKQSSDMVKEKDNNLHTSTIVQSELSTKQKDKKREGMKDEINTKGEAKIVESIAVFDKDSNKLKIVTCNKSAHNSESLKNKQEDILNTIKNFEIPEETSDDIILSVPRYNLNKFITTIDPKSISDGIEMLVSEFEEKLQTKKMQSNIQKTEGINSVISDEPAVVLKTKNIISSSAKLKEQPAPTNTLNFDIPEQVVVYDKSNNKLKVVPTKENPQIIEEAKRQNKTLGDYQAKTIADYALKHWLESDTTNKVLKEQPVTTNSKDPDFPPDLQKKIQEIREYSNKMTRFSSKLPETNVAHKMASYKSFDNDSKITEIKTGIKNISSKPEKILSHENQKVTERISDKELVFVGNICYWIPKLTQNESKTTAKLLKPQNKVEAREQNKLFDSAEVPFKTPNFTPKKRTEVVIGDSVLSRIVVVDNRKNPIDLWKPDITSKSSSSSKTENINLITKIVKIDSINKEKEEKSNIIESFGVPIKHVKESIQLNETTLKTEPKLQVTPTKLESNFKPKQSFQAAQLEKHTEKYSNIENPTSTILKDGSIKKSFKPIKIVMNQIDLPKMTVTKTKSTDEDLNKQKLTLNKGDEKKDGQNVNLQKHEPLISMQDKMKKGVFSFGSENSKTQILNSSANSVKLESSKSLSKSRDPVTSTTIRKESPSIEKNSTKLPKFVKSEEKSEKNIPTKEKTNISLSTSNQIHSIEANTVLPVPAANFEENNSVKPLDTVITTTVKIPKQLTIEKTKIDKEIKNLKKYKENVLNTPTTEKFDALSKTPSMKILTDQGLPKSKEDQTKNKTSFSNTWFNMESKPQSTSTTAKQITEIETQIISKENMAPKMKEEKLEKISAPSVKHIEKSKHLKSTVKQSTNSSTPQTKTDVTSTNNPKTSFKMNTPEFAKENNSVKEPEKIVILSTNQKDENTNVMQKSGPQPSVLKIPTSGSAIIEKKHKQIENLDGSKKVEPKKLKTEMKKIDKTKTDESIVNTSFVLIENPITDLKNKKVEEDSKNFKENILNTNINKNLKKPSTNQSEIKSEPIILGPPKPKLNETKRPGFVLVNSSSQTYSTAEPLIEQKSDTTNISSQTKLFKEKLQNITKIEPVLSVDKTNTFKNQEIKPQINLKTTETFVKTDSLPSEDKPENVLTQALPTQIIENELKMEPILPKHKSNQSKVQSIQLKIQPKTEKKKSETAPGGIEKSSTNLNSASVKNLELNKHLFKEDQMIDTSKVQSIKQIDESKKTHSTEIQTFLKEDVRQTKSVITDSVSSTISKQANINTPTVSVPFKPNESNKVENFVPLASILSKNLEEIARKNGILKTKTKQGKSKSINNHIFSYPELTGMSKPKSEQPKLVVDKSLPNRFNVDRQSTKQMSQKIETITINKPQSDGNTVKLQSKPNVPITSQSKPELLKSLSPLERAYSKIDKKLEEIKREIEMGDSRTATTSKASIADPNSLKEIRENFKTTKEEAAIEKSNESSSIKELPILDKTLNPKMDDENIIRKTYIPFSYHVTTPKEQPKSVQNNIKWESDAQKRESPFLNLNFLKNYIKEKPRTVDRNKEKSDSIFKQVTNMIKEELFTYQEIPKETGKKTIKLAEESLASQPTFDAKKSIKPGVIYNQVKNMLKEDLSSKTKSGPQLSVPNSIIPGATVKVQSVVTPSILDDNIKEKTAVQSVDATNLKVKVEKSEQLADMSEPKKELAVKIEQKASVTAERPAVAFAELSVVPESVIVSETPSVPKQSLKSAENQNVKKQLSTSINKKATIYDADQRNEVDTRSSVENFKKDVVVSTNIDQTVIKSNSVETNSSITSLKEGKTRELATSLNPAMETKSSEKELKYSKSDEEELYKILGISNATSSRKEFKEVPKPTESVMDRLRNYFEKSSPKTVSSTVIRSSQTDKTDSDISKSTELAQFEKSKPQETMSNTQQSKVLNDSNLIEAVNNSEIVKTENKITTESTEVNGTHKTAATDKIKNFLRTDSNNNSPYHMIKPLSLLEHLTNMDTEQIKIDHHMKFLTDSRSNSISSVESKSKPNSPKLQSSLLQAFEKDDVLMTPNPELVAKITVFGKEKKTDSKATDKISTKNLKEVQKMETIAKTKLSENQVSATDEKQKNKNKDEVKEEEEEEEKEDDIRKVIDKQAKASDKKVHPLVLTKASNDKSTKRKIETKPPDSKETSITPSKDTFREDSVKPLDESRSEPMNIIESPGPSILDEETDIDPKKISNIKNKISDEPPPISRFSPSISTLNETEISKPIQKNLKESFSSNNISSENLLLNSQQQQQQQQQINEAQTSLKVKPVDLDQQKQKFIKPSKPLIKQLNNVAKVNRNISSSVLDDFKIEMDRYNSAEATPEDKNKIVLKIKYLTKIEPSGSERKNDSESLTDLSKTTKNNDLNKKPK